MSFPSLWIATLAVDLTTRLKESAHAVVQHSIRTRSFVKLKRRAASAIELDRPRRHHQRSRITTRLSSSLPHERQNERLRSERSGLSHSHRKFAATLHRVERVRERKHGRVIHASHGVLIRIRNVEGCTATPMRGVAASHRQSGGKEVLEEAGKVRREGNGEAREEGVSTEASSARNTESLESVDVYEVLRCKPIDRTSLRNL